MFGTKQTFQFNVQGMTCGHCVKAVTEALEDVVGVQSARVDLDSARAEVVAKKGVASEALVAAVEEAGYEANLDN